MKACLAGASRRQAAAKASAAVVFAFLVVLIPPFFHPPFLWGTTLRALCLALAAALCLYAGRLRGLEVKLLFAFGIWLVISRMLNGDLLIRHETAMVLGFCTMFALVALGGMLNRESREKFLDWFSAIFCGFYTILGLLCIVVGIFQLELVNPLSDTVICAFNAGSSRMIILGGNPNYTGYYFFFSFSLLIWQFFRYRRPAVRGILLAAMLVDYLVILYTFSRNVKLCFSLCLGMLTVLLALEHLPVQKKSFRAGLAALLMCVCVPLGYKSFDLSAVIMGKLSELVVGEVTVVEPVEGISGEKEEEVLLYEDERRVFDDNGRFPIYRAALQVLRDHPGRLLTGSLFVMDDTNAYRFAAEQESGAAKGPDYVPVTMTHHHSSYLHVLMYTGLPGFLLLMAFLVLCAVKMVRVFFSEKQDMAVKSLTITLTGCCFYNLLETSWFYRMDFCACMFFLLAGMVLAYHGQLQQPTEG